MAQGETSARRCAKRLAVFQWEVRHSYSAAPRVGRAPGGSGCGHTTDFDAKCATLTGDRRRCRARDFHSARDGFFVV